MSESVPVKKVIEELDQYLDSNDFASAEFHLSLWLKEAVNRKDYSGQLSLLNEQIGLYRKLQNEIPCRSAIKEALYLVKYLKQEYTVGGATTYINAATGFSSFHDYVSALPLYQKAKLIYENRLSENDSRLASLYNNMAICLTAMNRFSEAESLYTEAISILQHIPQGEGEIAITYCNLADLANAEFGPEKSEEIIRDYLQKAEDCLNSSNLLHNGHYAFICEKCAPVFGFYGWFVTDKELKQRAERIYAGS